MSFPPHDLMIDWGHNYGGIYEEIPEIEPGAGHTLRDMEFLPAANGLELPYMHPSDFLKLPRIREEIVGALEEDTGATSDPKVSPLYRFGSEGDCFTTLPPELREMILCYLPTKDVLNLLLTSRIFASSPLSQNFWFSRFSRSSVISSLLQPDILSGKPSFGNWKALFRRLWHDIGLTNLPEFQNRKRVWDLIIPLADAVICLSKNPTLHGTPRKTFFQPDLREDWLRWRRLGGLTEWIKEFKRGSQALFVRTVEVPEVVVGIYVSRIHLGGEGFVTGLRFVDGEGTSTNLGYILQGKEIYIDLSNSDGGRKDRGFPGFHLAIGLRGIKALAVATAQGEAREWVGNPEYIPRGRLIPKTGAIRDLKGEFDVSVVGIQGEGRKC